MQETLSHALTTVHTHIHGHKLSHCHVPRDTPIHTFTGVLTITQSHVPSHAHTFTCSLSRSHRLPHMLTHTGTVALACTHLELMDLTLTHICSLWISRTHSHTHLQLVDLTRSLTYTPAARGAQALARTHLQLVELMHSLTHTSAACRAHALAHTHTCSLWISRTCSHTHLELVADLMLLDDGRFLHPDAEVPRGEDLGAERCLIALTQQSLLRQPLHHPAGQETRGCWRRGTSTIQPQPWLGSGPVVGRMPAAPGAGSGE